MFGQDISFYSPSLSTDKPCLALDTFPVELAEAETSTDLRSQIQDLGNIIIQPCLSTPIHEIPSELYSNKYTDKLCAINTPQQVVEPEWGFLEALDANTDDYLDLDQYLSDLNSIIEEEHKPQALQQEHHNLTEHLQTLLPASCESPSSFVDSNYYTASEASYNDSPHQQLLPDVDFNTLAPCTIKEMDSLDSEVTAQSQQQQQISASSKSDSRFWQYNSQAKGPKGKKFKLSVPTGQDPHQAVSFNDPVFDKYHKSLVKHVGKARKGDGNDMTPDPVKLLDFGVQIEKLNADMDGLNKLSKTNSKKEKNRLASQACRLKKKAHNEANKIKLHLIKKEQDALLDAIQKIKREISNQAGSSRKKPLVPLLASLKANIDKKEAAGRLPELVDDVIVKVKQGDKLGGLRL